MSPGPIEIGPASGPHVALEVNKTASPAPKSPSTPYHEEHQYLDLIRDILANGEHRPDRYYQQILSGISVIDHTIGRALALYPYLPHHKSASRFLVLLPIHPNRQRLYCHCSLQSESSYVQLLQSSSGSLLDLHRLSPCRNKASRSGMAMAVANI